MAHRRRRLRAGNPVTCRGGRAARATRLEGALGRLARARLQTGALVRVAGLRDGLAGGQLPRVVAADEAALGDGDDDVPAMQTMLAELREAGDAHAPEMHDL